MSWTDGLQCGSSESNQYLVCALSVYREAMHQVEDFGIEIPPVNHQNVGFTAAPTYGQTAVPPNALSVHRTAEPPYSRTAVLPNAPWPLRVVNRLK